MGVVNESLSARRLRLAAGWGVGLTAVGLGLIVLYVAWVARLLRPLADDYCQAAGAAGGVLNAGLTLYQTFSGQIVRETIGYAVVGWPLVHLPFALASALPFLLAATALTVWAFSAMKVSGAQMGRSAAAALLCSVPVLWWAFWWIPTMTSTDMDAAARADAITNWQTINSAYVINPSLVVVTWMWILRRRNWGTGRQIVVCAVAGLMTGLSDYSLAVAVLAMGLVVLLYDHLRGAQSALRPLAWAVAYAFSILGLAISYLAPGTGSRATAFAGTPLPAKTPASLLSWVFPEGLSTWLGVMASWGGMTILVVAIALGTLGALHRPVAHAKGLVVLGAGLLALSLVHGLVARLAEAFSYQGFWHIIGPATSGFIGILILGFVAGAAMSRRLPTLGVLVLAGSGALALFVAMSGVVSMSASMAARNVQWQSGSASTWAEDIEAQWVAGCWLQLGESRELPRRDGRT